MMILIETLGVSLRYISSVLPLLAMQHLAYMKEENYVLVTRLV